MRFNPIHKPKYIYTIMLLNMIIRTYEMQRDWRDSEYYNRRIYGLLIFCHVALSFDGFFDWPFPSSNGAILLGSATILIVIWKHWIVEKLFSVVESRKIVCLLRPKYFRYNPKISYYITLIQCFLKSGRDSGRQRQSLAKLKNFIYLSK